MSERFDLQRMLLEIKDDEAVNTEKTAQLSQEQIRELVTRRKAHDATQNSKPTDAH